MRTYLKSIITAAFALAAAFVTGSARAEVPSDVKYLVNFTGNAQTPDLDGWMKYNQTDVGGNITVTASSSGVQFATAGGGNFFDQGNPTIDFGTGAYTDINGATHESVAEEVKASLGLDDTVTFDTSVYLTGLMNGGAVGHTATISGLDPSKEYLVYAGFGRYKSDGDQRVGFAIATSGCASIETLEYVVSENGRNNNTTVAQDYQSFTTGTAISAGRNGVMIVRLNRVMPTSGGSVVFTLTGDRAGINFLAVKELAPEVLPETTFSQSTVKVSEINTANDFAECGPTNTVVVNLVGTTTLEFDVALKFKVAKIKHEGALTLDAETKPEDFGKFNFKGVTGGLVYGWLELGTGMAINFHSGGNRALGDNDDAGIPRLPIYGKCWNNVGDGTTGSDYKAKMFAPDGQTVIAETTTINSWSCPNVHQWDDATTPYLKGYLDDSTGVRINAEVPFDRYDLYIVCATDTANAKFSYKTVNGVNYSIDANGDIVSGSTTAWGASRNTTPVFGTSTSGNVMHIVGLTGNLSIVSTNSGGRGGIAAIVIVKTHEVRDYAWWPQSGDWVDVGNWVVGEDDATELPTQYDTVDFSARKAVSVVVPAEGVTVKAITIDKSGTTLQGGPITLTDKGYGSTIMGTATFVFDGGLPDTSIEDELQSDNWKGTVWLKNKTGLGNIDLSKYGNANTTVKCTDISGHFTPNKEFTGTLALENGEAGYALNIHDGSSDDGNVVTFDHLTGSGKILGDGGSTAGFLVKDWAGFTGDVAIGNKAITFGTVRKAGNYGNCKIFVNVGATYTLSGQTWSANDGIQIDGTIGGTGALVGTASLGLNATLDATGAELLTVNTLPAFALTNKFVVASAPEDGVPVKVLAAAEGVTLATKTYDTVPVIIVGDAEVECQCQVKAAEDGIYLEKVSGKFDLVLDAAKVTASDLNRNQLASADGSSIVTITLTGEDPTIVLDESIHGGDIKIVREGNLTISADAEPADWSKYDLRRVTGFIRYSWLAMKRVINLNFASGRGKFADGDTSSDGLLAGNTPKSSWVNLEGGNHTDIAVSSVWNAGASTAETIEGMTVSYVGGNYFSTQDNLVLYGYLDESGDDGNKIVLKGVPFEMYDLIVYLNNDTATVPYHPIHVNGVAYTWDAEKSATVVGSDTDYWGGRLSSGAVYGQNALRIAAIPGGMDITLITGKRDDTKCRGSIAAIQIVEIGSDFVTSYTAEENEGVRVSTLNSKIAEGEPYTGLFTLNLKGGDLIFDEAFVCDQLRVFSTGDLTIRSENAESFPASEFEKIQLQEVAGAITWMIPANQLVTSIPLTVYTVGVGVETAPVSLGYPVENGSMTLMNGPYYLGATAGGATSTVSFVDATIFATNGQGLAVGMADFTLSGATTVTASKVILSEGADNRIASLTMKDTAKIIVTGGTIIDQNTSSIMFGHWNGPSTFTMNDSAVFDATNAQVLVGKTSNNHTINLNGGTFVAKGIKASSSANLTNTLNLAGATLYLGEFGISSYSANTKIDVNVLEDTTIYATDPTITITQPITIAEGKKLTIDAGTNTISLIAGVNRDFRAFEFVGTTNIVITETMDEYLAGSVTVRGIPAGAVVTMERADWTKPSVELSDGEEEGEKVFKDASSRVSGPACWMDFTFTKDTLELRQSNQGTIENAGSAGRGIGLSYDTNYNAGNSYNTENGSLLGKATPYRHMTGNAEWPEQYTVAVCANVPDVDKGCIVAFGSSQGGVYGTSYVAIVRGDTADEILLMKGTASNQRAEVMSRMAADNATVAKHLVVFTNDGEKFTVYCDGIKINETAAFDLGKGFQVGSVHGGVATSAATLGKDATGITRVSEIERLVPENDPEREKYLAIKDACEIKSIRVFDRIITSEEMDLLCEEFPYIPKGGLYLRDFEGGTNLLQSAAAWRDSEATEQTTDLPTARTIDEVSYKPSIRVETDAETTLILNASLAAEKITFNGTKKLTITADGSTNTLKATSAVAVNCPIAIAYGEVDIVGSPLKIGENGSIEIDVAPLNIDVTTIFKVTDYQLTGLTDEAPGKITVKNAPYDDIYRTVEVVYANSQYWLRIGPARPAGEIVLPSGTESIWDGTVFLDENEVETLRFYQDDVIVVKDRFEALDFETGLAVPVGAFRVAEYGYLAFAGWSSHGTVTVDAGGVFDMKGINGKDGPFYRLVLNGGSYVNTVAPEGVTDALDNNTYPVTSIALTADSFLGATNTFGLVNQSHRATSFDFGETNVLTKVGEAPVVFTTTTFSGAGTLKVAEGSVDFRGYTIASNALVKVEVPSAGALTLTSQSNKSEFSRFDIACDGFLTVKANMTVDDLTGSGSVSGEGQLTINGTADYTLVPTSAVISDGATIRLGTGRSELKDEPLTCLGAVTFDAVDGAKLRGKGIIAHVLGDPVFTPAFTAALKASDRKVEIVQDAEGVFVEIKPIPRFLLMLK